MKNTYEKLFDEFLDLTEFSLLKHRTESDDADVGAGLFSLEDHQGANLGDIESERFETAAQILDRMDNYIQDYIVEALSDILDEAGINLEEDTWEGLLEYRDKIPEADWDFDVLDMIINRPDKIDLNNCDYSLVD